MNTTFVSQHKVLNLAKELSETPERRLSSTLLKLKGILFYEL